MGYSAWVTRPIKKIDLLVRNRELSSDWQLWLIAAEVITLLEEEGKQSAIEEKRRSLSQSRKDHERINTPSTYSWLKERLEVEFPLFKILSWLKMFRVWSKKIIKSTWKTINIIKIASQHILEAGSQSKGSESIIYSNKNAQLNINSYWIMQKSEKLNPFL